MNKKECIDIYGKEKYARMLKQNRERNRVHPDQIRANSRKWADAHPDQVLAQSQKHNRKGGKGYKKMRRYKMTGVPHTKGKIRTSHANKWAPYKQIIAPKAQLHHEWLLGTARYRGVALVEANQHMHGFIDVIQIMEGEITLLREEEVRMGGV